MTEPPGKPIVVIIPTTAFSDMLRGTLDALRVQTFDGFDVLIVGDGIEDPVPDWLSEGFPAYRVHCMGGDPGRDEASRRGFARTVNRAIISTRHSLVFLLNDDARPAPDCLGKLYEAQKRNPDFSGFACKIVFHYSPGLIESAGDGFSCAGRGFHRGWREKDAPPFDREEEVFGPCAAAALYRRCVFDKAGLFEEEFFAVHEDVDLAMRARRFGFRFLYVPSAVVLHKGSATLGRKSEAAVYYDARNSELLLLKNVPLPDFLKIAPWYLLYTYYAFVNALRFGRAGSFLSGKLAVLPRIPRMLRKGTLVHLQASAPFSEVAAHFDKAWHRRGIRRVASDPKKLMFAVAPLLLLAMLPLLYLLSSIR